MVILKLGVFQDEVEDLTQKVLITLWEKLPSFEYQPGKCKFRTWMNTVIRNAVIDFHRSKNRKIKTIDSKEDIDTESFPLNNDEFSRIIDKEWRAHITNLALESIRPTFKGNAMQVFELHLSEMPTKEIAEELEIAEASVYKLRSRVEEKLIQEIKRLKAELEF